MPDTLSTMLPLGTRLPPIRLVDAVSGRAVDAAEIARGKKGLLVTFICNHCPFVKHILAELVRVAHAALDQGLAVVAVNSNDEKAYPQDGPVAMRTLAQEKGWRFPFLFDESQAVAKAFGAACTPDFYLFDEKLQLVYRGQFDDSRPGNGKPVTGASLSTAIQALVEKRAPSTDQKPSVGCNIKWKPGNEPEYYG
jgi:hypothetical protein